MILAMKNFILLHLLFLSTMSIAQTEDVLKIEFKSMNRGIQEYILISSETIFTMKESRISSEKNSEKRSIQKSEWANLLQATKNLKFTEIPDLKSPTMNRAYDGAMHSEIRITTSKSSYSHLFDDENPHENLKPLMTVITQLKN